MSKKPKCPKCYCDDEIKKVNLFGGLLSYWNCGKCHLDFAFIANKDGMSSSGEGAGIVNPGTSVRIVNPRASVKTTDAGIAMRRVHAANLTGVKAPTAIPLVTIVNPGNSLYCMGTVDFNYLAKNRNNQYRLNRTRVHQGINSYSRFSRNNTKIQSRELLLIKSDMTTFNPSLCSTDFAALKQNEGNIVKFKKG